MKSSPEELKKLIESERENLASLEWKLAFMLPINAGFNETMNKLAIKERYIDWLIKKWAERHNKLMKEDFRYFTRHIMESIDHGKVMKNWCGISKRPQ